MFDLFIFSEIWPPTFSIIQYSYTFSFTYGLVKCQKF
jgi:hypothetical protein